VTWIVLTTSAFPAGGARIWVQVVGETARPRTNADAGDSRLVVVPSTLSGPLPSPTFSLPVESTFAARAALPGSTMFTS
jgi:hypothetical protein